MAKLKLDPRKMRISHYCCCGAFLAYIEQYLVPTPKWRDVVVVDNVPFHKVAGVEDAIQAVHDA